jgi:hypothetical protein
MKKNFTVWQSALDDVEAFPSVAPTAVFAGLPQNSG